MASLLVSSALNLAIGKKLGYKLLREKIEPDSVKKSLIFKYINKHY